MRVVVCGEQYAIDLMRIREVIRPRSVTEIPWTAPYLLGLVSLRGTLVPVLDLALRLGRGEGRAGSRERVVVVRAGDGLVGLRVDQVGQVIRLTPHALLPVSLPPDGLVREFVAAVASVDGVRIGVLDLERIADPGDLIIQERQANG